MPKKRKRKVTTDKVWKLNAEQKQAVSKVIAMFAHHYPGMCVSNLNLIYYPTDITKQAVMYDLGYEYDRTPQKVFGIGLLKGTPQNIVEEINRATRLFADLNKCKVMVVKKLA